VADDRPGSCRRLTLARLSCEWLSASDSREAIADEGEQEILSLGPTSPPALGYSHYAHGHPFAFVRNDDQRRDGLANEVDKMYMPGVLRWLASLPEDAKAAYGQVPAGPPE
jgi:hypothetical protein